MEDRKLNMGSVASVALCAILVGVGLVRLASYSEGALGVAVCNSIVGFLCYDPASRLSAQFFKILATPTVIAGIYFFFRWRNAGRPSHPGATRHADFHRLDFESPLLRGILTSLVMIHWLGMEWWKFNVEGFYPWSPLESRLVNVVVLLASQALAFWGMKFLSFGPIKNDAGH